ncbi:hypothetical protein BG011_006399 [Mortierella polycephala]|uniref:Mif2 N-terminal domain-containing protein n=1 Tax=Mortierella polycephala TaxID=41804 RepID=A0A9P6PW75_9FUNG|nr:hypothetical protein BG011_006399 [Mortierella polycephala]
MASGHDGESRARGIRFHDIGVVGRRTGIAMKANIKKDADGLDNIDDFWDDGNDDHRRSSASNSAAQNRTSFVGSHRDQRDHNVARLDGHSVVEEEADDIENARRQHPPWLSGRLEYGTSEENQIPNELLSTPSSRRSGHASFRSLPFDSNFSSRTDSRRSGGKHSFGGMIPSRIKQSELQIGL